MKTHLALGAALFFAAAALPVSADTIIQESGTGGNPAEGDHFNTGGNYASWLMGSTTYTGATISAALAVPLDPLATAYLLEGATFDTATQIDVNSSVLVSSMTPSFINIFSNETLLAGDTYYLVIVQNTTSPIGWESAQTVVQILGPGVADIGPDKSDTSANDGSLPASNAFLDLFQPCVGNPQTTCGAGLLFEVQGNSSGVPEPATVALVGAGLVIAGLFRKWRR